MYPSIRRAVAAIILVAFMAVPLGSNALAQVAYKEENRTANKMTADAVLVRPVGLVSIVCGAAVWLVSLPFSALAGNTNEAYEKLVVDPAKFTFQRPLGDFSGLEYE